MLVVVLCVTDDVIATAGLVIHQVFDTATRPQGRCDLHFTPVLPHYDLEGRRCKVSVSCLAISSTCVRMAGSCHVDLSKLQPVEPEIICLVLDEG